MTMNAKPISELSAADLDTSPIWEWAYDEEECDETCVRPTELSAVPREGEYHVALLLTTATGATLHGLASVCDGELETDGIGAVAAAGGYWVLDSPPHGRRETAWFVERFGAAFAELFPVAWSARVAFAGEAELRRGILPAAT
jgi:hypothetical protein